jgi:hypothetical protein
LQRDNRLLALSANAPSRSAGLFRLQHARLALPLVERVLAARPASSAMRQRMMKLPLAARPVNALNDIGSLILTEHQPPTAGALLRVPGPAQIRPGLSTRARMETTSAARWELLASSTIARQLPALASPLRIPLKRLRSL